MADKETRAFGRDLLHSCKEAIKDLLEPVNGEYNIFAALDNALIQQPAVAPLHNDEPEPSNRRARGG